MIFRNAVQICGFSSVLAIVAIACSAAESLDARVKSIGHAWGIEPHPTEEGMWIASCKDGTKEVRTTKEVESDKLCQSGPKFVMRSKTVVSFKSFGNRDVRNCVVPQGAVIHVATATLEPIPGSVDSKPLNDHSKYEPEIRDGRYVVRFPYIGSAIAAHCESSSLLIEEAEIFVANADFRDYDVSIYGPRRVPNPCDSRNTPITMTMTSTSTAIDTSTEPEPPIKVTSIPCPVPTLEPIPLPIPPSGEVGRK